MYCKYCGTEISDNATFCTNCGKNQGEEVVKSSTSSLVKESIGVIKSFFSRTPFSAIEKSTECSVGVGIIFMLINVFLFGFVTCHTLIQLLNHILSTIVTTFGETIAISEAIDMTSSLASKMSIEVNYGLLFPMSLVMLLVLALENILVYLLQKFYKIESINWKQNVNVISVASLPITIGLLTSLILGAIYPPLVIGIFIGTLIVHTLFLYKAVIRLVPLDNEPITQFIVLIFAMCVIITLVGCGVMNQAMSELMSDLINSIYSATESLFDLF